MPFQHEALALAGEEHRELLRISASRSLPAGVVFRARLILMLAEGYSYSAIQEALDTTAPTISRWRTRFLENRISGLMEIRRRGRQATPITPELRVKLLNALSSRPNDGSGNWSCRKLAKELGISKDTVHKLWLASGLAPQREREK